MPDAALNPVRGGVRVAVRLQPRARVDRLIALVAAAGEGHEIRASVTQPAADGRANEALLLLLSRAWRLPRRNLAIVAGVASRHKLVHVSGDPVSLIEYLGRMIAALPGGSETPGHEP